MIDENGSDHDLLIRIDEKVRQVAATMETRDIYHKGEMDRLTILFRETVTAFTNTITNTHQHFVTRSELAVTHDNLKGSVSRLERIVYGACGLILIAVIGALMTVVLRGGHL